MGGKSKAIRTKNNSQPSSSSRCAALLGTNQTPLVGFKTMGNVDLTTSSTTVKTTDELINKIDLDYQLIFKKMCKKDSTTRSKALQEFIENVSSETTEVDAVIKIAQIWCRMYITLATDIEHRVRELTQNAHGVFVTKIGKNITSILRQICPFWIACRFDTYGSAAKLAENSFNSLFPGKLEKVFVVYQNEILQFLREQLTVAQECSESDTDGIIKCGLIIKCSLQCFFLYIQTISSDDFNKKQSDAMFIINSKQFWSFYNHKSPYVRSAWFECIAILLKTYPDCLNEYKKTIVINIFNSLHENNAIVLHNLWSAAVFATRKLKNWHNTIDIENVILSKILKTIQIGGNAQIKFPYILPLVEALSAAMAKENRLSFYDRLLSNYKVRLASPENVNNTELAQIQASYIEVIQFIIANAKGIIDDDTKYREYCIRQIDTHILDNIKWIIINYKIGFEQMFQNYGKLLLEWHKIFNEKESPDHRNIIKHCWTNIYKLLEQMLTEHKSSDHTLKGQSELMINLSMKNKIKDEKQYSEYNKNLNMLIYKLCKLYIKEIDETCNIGIAEFIRNIFHECANTELLQLLAGLGSIADFANTFILWLLKPSLRHENVVDIILILFTYLESDEQNSLLVKLLQYSDESVNQWVLTKMLCGSIVFDSKVLNLVLCNTPNKVLLKYVDAAIVEEKLEHLQFLVIYFRQENISNDWMQTAMCQQILNIIVKPFNNEDPSIKLSSIELCAQLVMNILSEIVKHSENSKITLFLWQKLFELSINLKISNSQSNTTQIEQEISTFWQNMIIKNNISISNDLMNECLNIVENKLTSNDININHTIGGLSEIVANLINSMMMREKSTNKELFDIFNNFSSKSSLAPIEKLCFYGELINGTLIESNISIENSITENNDVELLEIILKRALFNAATLSNVFNNENVKIDEEFLKSMPNTLLHLMYISTLANSLMNTTSDIIPLKINYSLELENAICSILKHIPKQYIAKINETIEMNAREKGSFWAWVLTKFVSGNDMKFIVADMQKEDCKLNNSIIQAVLRTNKERSLPIVNDIFNKNINLFKRMNLMKCFIENYFQAEYNDVDDHQLIVYSLSILHELSDGDKSCLLYQTDVSELSDDKIRIVTQIADFFIIVIKYFPQELDTQAWDIITLTLSAWILNYGKSAYAFQKPKVSIFIAAVARLFHQFITFITAERMKSSTKKWTTLIEEWDHVFSKNVNLLLIKYFMEIVNVTDSSIENAIFLKSLSENIISVDLKYTFLQNVDINVNLIINFALNHISHKNHYVRWACFDIMNKLSDKLILDDVSLMQTYSGSESCLQHSLYHFEDVMKNYQNEITNFISKSKLNDFFCTNEIPVSSAIPYLMTWDCILDFCAKAPAEVRSLFASFITGNEFDKLLFITLFNFMPTEIFKNFDSIQIRKTYFAPLSRDDVQSINLSIEKYACFIYVKTLRHLPVIARKWWLDLNPRQKSIVDKITTHCVSNQLCDDELRSLIENRERADNMQLTVHISSREVLATYSIDEARLELTITLPINHPLGAIKVDCGKQIGSRLQSRVLVMQLAMFLTHQNGSIRNVLLLWKKNLDRKFEGVEECYVCYSVIHQNTCQLPKLSCKTCKKKFHGPCLYKWFSTSNKSTCPICRNIF